VLWVSNNATDGADRTPGCQGGNAAIRNSAVPGRPAPICKPAMGVRMAVAGGCQGLLPFHSSAALETENRVLQGVSRRSWRATIKTRNAAERDFRPNPSGQGLFYGNPSF